jgi:hypothetical protein
MSITSAYLHVAVEAEPNEIERESGGDVARRSASEI